MTPDARKKNDFGYSRLETYASETNIDGTLTRNLSGRKTDKNSVQSRDDLYESTVTVTSNIDSVDNSLFSLTEESSRGAGTQVALSASNDSLGLFNVSSGTPEAHIYLEFQNEQPTPAPDAVYAKVNKSQKQKQKGFQTRTDDIIVGGTEEGFEMVENKYTVTCTAELKPNNNEDETIVDETSLDMVSAMSFDDTIKAFENFKELEFGPETKAAEFSESQTERAENVITYQAPQITRKKTESVTTDNSQASSADSWFTVTGSGGNNVSTWSTSQTNTMVTTERQKNQQTNFTNVTVTTTTNTAEPSGFTLLNKGQHDDLEDELDKSVNALLFGIDVDTSEWAAIKDKGVNSDSDNDTFEVYTLQHGDSSELLRNMHFLSTLCSIIIIYTCT
jgi:hypothetical protein